MPSEPRNEDTKGAFLAYNSVLAALSPGLLAWYAYRVLGSGKSREGWLQRLGWPAEQLAQVRPGENIWLHAVSVGEVAAAAPVVRHYRDLEGAYPLEVSTITSTGREMASRLLKDLPHFFLPVDLLPAVRSVMQRLEPLCLTLTESELWPNLINEANRVGAECVLINGVVSDSTIEKAHRFGWIYRWTLGNMGRLLMQSDEDAERIVALGARPERVEVAGNTKFDEAEQPLGDAERHDLAAAFGLDGADRVFVAGSTNPGEDEPVLDAFSAARQAVPELKLIVAPRQVERADEVAAMAAERGLSSVKRSEINGPHQADVIILNTFGELARVYALGQAAFVGGTLIDKGGHNILQPLAQGVPVVFGPFDYKIRDIGGKAMSGGAAFRVETAAELRDVVDRLIRQDQSNLRERALQVVSANRGASARCAAAMHEAARSAAVRRGRA